jgi:hypothetical protein
MLVSRMSEMTIWENRFYELYDRNNSVMFTITELKDMGWNHDDMIPLFDSFASLLNIGLVYIIVHNLFREDMPYWANHPIWGYKINLFLSGDCNPKNFITQNYLL